MPKKSKIPEDLQLKICKEYKRSKKNVQQIADKYGLEYYMVTNILKRHNIEIHRKEHVRAKKVRCIETGEIFASARLGAIAMGGKSGNSNMILQNAKGITEQAHGYTWEFVNKQDRPKKINRKKFNNSYILNKLSPEVEQGICDMYTSGIPVKQIAEELNVSNSRIYTILRTKCLLESKKTYKPVKCLTTGKIYESVNAASLDTGISKEKIYNNCRGRLKKAEQLKFEYLKD